MLSGAGSAGPSLLPREEAGCKACGELPTSCPRAGRESGWNDNNMRPFWDHVFYGGGRDSHLVEEFQCCGVSGDTWLDACA